MEVYILDSLLRRETVVDRFESLVWAERWREFGDFQLVLQSTRENRARFTNGTKLAMNDSMRGMTVETVEDTIDEEGRALLKIKGKSFETILMDRVAKRTLSNLTAEATWKTTGKPADVIRTMFDTICRTGALSTWDKIPFLQPGSIYPVPTIAEPQETITWEQPVAPLYSVIKELCDLYDLGFRLVRNFDTSQLYFDIYTGNDRTTQQSIHPPVVFSPQMDNLQNTNEFTTIEDTKNCAYVFSEQGFQVVYPVGVDPEVAGFDRRVLLVEADVLTLEGGGTPTTAQINAHLVQKGNEALSTARPWSAFEGEHSQNSEYKYGVHYELGDLVEMRNADGVANTMRVTEQIFASDQQGERSYPTLAINQFINPGAWLAWNFNQVWEDLGLTTYWADQA